MSYGQPPYYGRNNYGYQQQYAYQYQQPMQQTMQQPMYLQGKIVDNESVVMSIDIPLDGSTSFFPLANGSAIVTKKLMPDGTSKTLIYKPVFNEATPEQPQYVTIEEFEKAIKNSASLQEEIDNLKKQLDDLNNKMKNNVKKG